MNKYPYLPNSPEDLKKAMLKDMNLSSINELYKDVPKEIFFKGELNIPKSKSEIEVIRHINEKLGLNQVVDLSRIFIGGGVWPHIIPSIIPAIINRGEFLTAYTP